MNAHAKIAEPPVAAGVQDIAVLYQRTYDLYSAVDAGPDGSEVGYPMFAAVSELASAALRRPPMSLGDLALQMGLAAAWINMVADKLGKESLAGSTAASLEVMVHNALFYIVETGDLRIEGEPLDVLNRLFAEAKRFSCSEKEERS